MSQTKSRAESQATSAARLPRGARPVRYTHSSDFLGILHGLQASLLVSTYQAGQLVAVGTEGPQGDRLALGFHPFRQAMGIAVSRGRIAVGSHGRVWQLEAAPELAGRGPAEGHDACYLARRAHLTGEIHVHELGWAADELWLVNTRFSCLCTLDERHSFVPRWRPPFVSELAADDRCHLNGLALAGGRPAYVTALAESDEPSGWRPHKAHGGCLIDVGSGQTVAGDFAMPHSPRVHAGRLWLLDSGRGRLVTVDRSSGAVETVCELPGYTRGLAFAGPYAFVGLSRIRQKSAFDGLPLAERGEPLRCGVAVVDLRGGRAVAYLEFKQAVDEIFDVQVIPGVCNPALVGPAETVSSGSPVWLVPRAG